MATAALLTLSIMRALTSVMGALIVALGARAYLASRRPTMLWFTLGVGIVTTGFLVEGLLFEIAGWSLERAMVVEASLTLAAFALLVASLFVRERRTMAAASKTTGSSSPRT